MFPTVLGVAVPLITFVLLTAVGCDLTLADFRAVRQRPSLVIAGLLVPPLLLPVLAVGLIAWMAPPPAVGNGLLLIATCPVGGISNTWTYLARGATALSVTLTTLSCALAIVTIPALGWVAAYVSDAPASMPLSPAGLVFQVFAMVVLPVAVGMQVRRRWPQFAVDRQLAMQRTGFVLLAGLIALIVGSDPAGFVAELASAVPLASAFIISSVAVGGAVGHAVGGSIGERVALAIEFATRNVAVATALAVSVGRLELATFATTYFLVELPLMLVAVVVFRAWFAPLRTSAVRSGC